MIHKKEHFFLENTEKYEEMLKNINKMKNMVLDLDDSNFVYKSVKERINVNNIINSTGSGNETNLSCSVSSNDDSKQSFCNKGKIKSDDNNIKSIKNINKGKEDKENNKIEGKKFLGINKDIKQINIPSNKNISKGFILPNNIIDLKLPNFPEIIVPNSFNNNIKHEKYNTLFYEEDNSIESNDFSFQELPDITEKEISVSNNLNNYNNNPYHSEEKTEKNFESNDCYSKITNLYFQTYQHKMDINI